MVGRIVALTALLVVLSPVNHGFVCGNWWYPGMWKYPYIGELHGGWRHHYPLEARAIGRSSSSFSAVSDGDGIGDASSAAASTDGVFLYSGLYGRYKHPETSRTEKYSGHTVELHVSQNEHATVKDDSAGVSSSSSSEAAVEVVDSTGTDGDAGSSLTASSSADSEACGTGSNNSCSSSESSATASSDVVASENSSVPEEDEHPGCFGIWGYDSVYGHAGIVPAAEVTGSSSSTSSSSAASGVDGGTSSSSSAPSSSSMAAEVSESVHPFNDKLYGGYEYPGYFGHWGYSGIYRQPFRLGPAGVFGSSSSSSSATNVEDGADATASSSSMSSSTPDFNVPAPWYHGPLGAHRFLWPYGYWKYPAIGTSVAGILGSFARW